MDARPAPARELTYSRPEMGPLDRLSELIVYIARVSAYDKTFGVTKLNKLLWWSDLYAFGLRGKPITGCKYVRLPQGPVPDGIDDLRDAMCARREIAISKEDHFGKTKHRVLALRSANLEAFTGEEIAIVDEVIRLLKNNNATHVSRRSHGRMWEALRHRSPMPYESVFISENKPTRYDVARTKELGRRFGWK